MKGAWCGSRYRLPAIHVLSGLKEEQISHPLNDHLWGRRSPHAAGIARILSRGYSVELLRDTFRNLICRQKWDALLIDAHPAPNEEMLLTITISNILISMPRPIPQDG